jgi:Na+(H+)/acetate symporter ActP
MAGHTDDRLRHLDAARWRIAIALTAAMTVLDILKHASAVFPLRNPGLISIPLSFAVAILVAVIWPEHAADTGFDEVERRVHTGAEAAIDVQ